MVVLVSGVAVKRNRKLLDGRWDKHDTKDAANIADNPWTQPTYFLGGDLKTYNQISTHSRHCSFNPYCFELSKVSP